jgi:hypothetical protein
VRAPVPGQSRIFEGEHKGNTKGLQNENFKMQKSKWLPPMLYVLFKFAFFNLHFVICIHKWSIFVLRGLRGATSILILLAAPRSVFS